MLQTQAFENQAAERGRNFTGWVPICSGCLRKWNEVGKYREEADIRTKNVIWELFYGYDNGNDVFWLRDASEKRLGYFPSVSWRLGYFPSGTFFATRKIVGEDVQFRKDVATARRLAINCSKL